MHNRLVLLLVLCWCCFSLLNSQIQAEERSLEYAAAPAENPLKGLVPYSGQGGTQFPFTLEFNYLPLSDLMLGMHEFNWQPLEKLLDEIAARGNQTTFRIWMEYPGREDGIPKFLVDDGLKVHEWLNTNTQPFPPTKVYTPDYEDPRLRTALKNFIAAMGKKYDGDPRVGYITAGLLGTWGEWHDYPKVELFASKTVQIEVMDAYAAAFKKTPVLLRYPAGTDTYLHASNVERPFGYHDDSFSWATIETGKKQDDWFFMPAMKAAGAADKWKKQPIGGEIRPELWGKIFDTEINNKQAQDFATCVEDTHVTWLMDSGMFTKKASPDRIARALKQVARMGYEFHVMSANLSANGQVAISIRNTGVAPFYHDWKLELGAVDSSGKLVQSWSTDWQLIGILPETEPARFHHYFDSASLKTGNYQIVLRVINPLKNGKPLRFANTDQNRHLDGWLSLGELQIP